MTRPLDTPPLDTPTPAPEYRCQKCETDNPLSTYPAAELRWGRGFDHPMSVAGWFCADCLASPLGPTLAEHFDYLRHEARKDYAAQLVDGLRRAAVLAIDRLRTPDGGP